MIPPSSYLTTWDFSADPCETSGSKFLGILCSFPQGNSTSRITALELDSVGYEGFLPPRIGTLTALTTLDLSGNKFRGPVPETIKNLNKLTRISLSGNFFTGGIWTWIYRLKKLERINLSGNQLSGRIPARISKLRRLTHLSLSNNEFSQRIPSLYALENLQTLELDSNILIGSLPKLPSGLTTLRLSHNKLTGHITSLVDLEHLLYIDLSDNWFSGPVNRGVLALPRLTYLNVSFNKFKKMEVNNYFGSGSRLRTLDAQWNLLQGHLPVKLVNFERLVVINLSHNQFTGEIPIGYAQRLGRPWRTLFLDHNYLLGRVSVEFGSAVARIRGSLANNCLRCPLRIPLCRGQQRPASACHGYTQNTTNHLENY
ncbi:LRR receptor-like serine/threonine-protein kinase FLS2-like [Hibiscus syriacus]|uniref:LRR receptor-like serine/threonine-protein kinase FLS2-like n=2 Tax=Hibiscus syriacus TaxID=106335 RepID=A0A6A2ZYM3_HIBSY|nr:LRR receptor-like serine/threonine-protein kinase FLS2-like [Hibiscus syriacus]